MKSALSIVAFTVTFGFSVLLIGLLFGFPQSNFDYTKSTKTNCYDQTRYKIERLINQDIRNGERRDSMIRRFERKSSEKMTISEYSVFVKRYVDKSERLNDSGLPAEFQESWREHMKAWRDYSNFLNKQKYGSFSNVEFNDYDIEFNNEINRTWYNTLRIGESHGASFNL